MSSVFGLKRELDMTVGLVVQSGLLDRWVPKKEFWTLLIYKRLEPAEDYATNS